mgnify:CR=1 FL=1
MSNVVSSMSDSETMQDIPLPVLGFEILYRTIEHGILERHHVFFIGGEEYGFQAYREP